VENNFYNSLHIAGNQFLKMPPREGPVTVSRLYSYRPAEEIAYTVSDVQPISFASYGGCLRACCKEREIVLFTTSRQTNDKIKNAR
jgi:hypothetical protein